MAENEFKIYTADTCAIMSCFSSVFGILPTVSERSQNLIREAIYSRETSIRIAIPSTVFIEIFELWLKTSEHAEKIYYEVFTPIKQSINCAIQPISEETIREMGDLTSTMSQHDMHDKLILCTALELKTPLITSDGKLLRYLRSDDTLPGALE